MKNRVATHNAGAPGSTSVPAPTPAPAISDLGRARQLAEARTSFEKARLALEMGKARLAVTLLESCLDVETDHPEYLGLWGYSQTLIGGNLKAALDACERAIAARSYDATLHAQLGTVLQECGRQHEARQCFENALQKDPQNKLAKTQLQALGDTNRGFSFTIWLRSLRG